MMGISNDILARLAKTDDCVPLEVLDLEFPNLTRRIIVKAMLRLKYDQLADRPSKACYRATPAGREFVAAGKMIKSGPNKPLTGARKRNSKAFVNRLWKALRTTRKGTTALLVSFARNKTDGNPEINAQRLLNAWYKSGFITIIGKRIAGTAPTSNGYVTWFIVRDNGPGAPLWSAKHQTVTDTNTKEVFNLQGQLINSEPQP